MMLTPLQRQIVERARAIGVPPEIALGQVEQESGFNPNATGAAGEYGLFQIHPKTAPEVGLTPQNAYDVNRNIDAGLGYMKRMLDLNHGDVAKALMSYNGGFGHVQDGTVSRRARGYSGSVQNRAQRFAPEVLGASPGYGDEMYKDDPAMMYGGGSSYGAIGDPTADAMSALPEVSRSAVDMDTIQSTMRVADKLTSGGVTGSLTSPSDREANSTGALAAEMIPTWQTAQKLLNPVNLLQLPMRALRMVDYTLRTAAGAPTLTDSAEQALGFINSGETIMRDPTATARDAAQQELTTAKGLRGQILNPAQKLVHIFTTDPFEGERRAITSSRAMQAGLAAQVDLDKAFKGRVERDQKTAEAPYEVAKKRAEAQKATAEAPFAARMAEAQVRNLEALPEYRQQSLFSQQLAARRNMLTQPDERGYSPLDRYRMSRDTADDVRRAEAEERARREREQDMADRAAARADDRSFAERGRLQDDTRAALAAAVKAKTADDANLFLAGTPYEAKPNGNWLGRKFDIVPRQPDAAAPAAAPAAAAPAMSGPTNYDAAMGKAREKARQALLRQGNATPSQRQIDDMATELLHQAGIR